jgi:hypothetical protein
MDLQLSGMNGETKYCRECGQQLRSEATFCDRCGAEVPQGSDQATTTGSEGTDNGRFLTRRNLIAGGAVVAMGASGVYFASQDDFFGPEFERAEDAWSNRREEENVVGALGRVTYDLDLPTGKWAARDYTPDAALVLEIRLLVETANRAEIFVIDQRVFDGFQEGEGVPHYQSLYTSGADLRSQGRVEPGEYYIIVDNSSYSEIEAEGRVTGELELTLGV